MDCIARIAGLGLLGECSVSEYEMNLRGKELIDSLVASATIAAPAAYHHAAFSCEIHSVIRGKPYVVAEAQGTVLKTQKRFTPILKKFEEEKYLCE